MMGGLTFYSNYLNNVAVTPNKQWRNEQQAFVSEMFDNSTIVRYDIYEEGYPFDFKFIYNPECWISTVLDVTTGMVKNSDDYRSLYFKNIEHEVGRGRYFKWADNYWMVYETTTSELETISTCNIRRCNNWLKWVTDKGELIQYPCVIEGELTSANAQVAKTISQANSHIDVIVQGNPDTLGIKKNDRFIINGMPYRFYAINNYMQVDYVDDNCPMLFMDFYLDMTIDEDNLIENIANDIRSQFKVETNVNQISNDVGYIDNLVCKCYHDNELLHDVRMEYFSTNTDIVQIGENGEYQLVDYGTAMVIAQIKGNPMSAVTIPVTVSNSIPTSYQILVDPMITYIKQNRSQLVTAKVVDNMNNVINTEILLSIEGGDSMENYRVVDNHDNSWTITNQFISRTPITLTFTNTEYNLEYSMVIELRAMF